MKKFLFLLTVIGSFTASAQSFTAFSVAQGHRRSYEPHYRWQKAVYRDNITIQVFADSLIISADTSFTYKIKDSTCCLGNGAHPTIIWKGIDPFGEEVIIKKVLFTRKKLLHYYVMYDKTAVCYQINVQ
jgi:hypothetical protein